jgi:hypothetical protein
MAEQNYKVVREDRPGQRVNLLHPTKAKPHVTQKEAEDYCASYQAAHLDVRVEVVKV